MSIAKKRREAEAFSIAFLDCICCGFGAMLLVFVLTVSQQQRVDHSTVVEVQARVTEVEKNLTTTQASIDELARQLAQKRMDLEAAQTKKDQDALKLTDRQREMMLLLQQTSAMKEALSVLLDKQKLLPTDQAATVPVPQVDRTQYLTGVKLEGDYIIFLVRASGSMLDNTIDGAAARLNDPDYLKRAAPKWQRVVRSLEWMISNLDPDTHFRIYLFNDETVPLLPERADDWFTRRDKQALGEIVSRLNNVVPGGGANLERAFSTVRFLPRLPDSIVLFTDGLPTLSDSLPTEGAVGEEQRRRFFDVAERQIRGSRIPVSTIMFPIDGDPAAVIDYWSLANDTRGALISPSQFWPES